MIAIIVIAVISVTPMVYKAITSSGIKTAGINADNAVAATTDMNGEWKVIPGGGANTTSVGYTFHEVLPGQAKDTSGTTFAVSGQVTISDDTLTAGEVSADLTQLKTDVARRDVAVRMDLLHTDAYPTATFKVTQPVSVKELPANGNPGQIQLTGDLTIHGTTKTITAPFDALRTGNRVVVAAKIPFNRVDYGVTTPEMIAAKVEEQGTLDIRLVLEK